MAQTATYIDKDHNNRIREDHAANDVNEHAKFPVLEDAVIRRQDTGLDPEKSERIHQLVNIPVLECGDKDVHQRQIDKVLTIVGSAKATVAAM